MSPRTVIRLASAADDARILAFLRTHWRADHVFVLHPELYRWQHRNPDDAEGRHFMLALDADAPEDQSLLGVLGFMPFRRFDPEANWTALALAIWKVRDDAGAPGLGLQLLKAVQRVQSPSLIAAIGISAIVRPIYDALGYTVGTMTHHALFPSAHDHPVHLARGVPAEARRPVAADPGLALIPITDEALPDGISREAIDALGAGQCPAKSWHYIVERYLRHPWYDYAVRAVIADGCLEAILVWRRVEAEGSAVLRLVDVIGRTAVLARCGAALREVTAQAACEYLDLVEHGVPAPLLRAAGFVDTTTHDTLILPNYFEPFESRNVPVDFAYRRLLDQTDVPLQLFRADSDQDRPNSSAALSASRRAIA